MATSGTTGLQKLYLKKIFEGTSKQKVELSSTKSFSCDTYVHYLVVLFADIIKCCLGVVLELPMWLTLTCCGITCPVCIWFCDLYV